MEIENASVYYYNIVQPWEIYVASPYVYNTYISFLSKPHKSWFLFLSIVRYAMLCICVDILHTSYFIQLFRVTKIYFSMYFNFYLVSQRPIAINNSRNIIGPSLSGWI